MKALMMIYNAAIESMVLGCMKECSLKSYTKFPGIHGSGESGGSRLDTHVWPGINNALLVVTEDENIPSMLEKIKSLKESHPDEGIMAFVFSVENKV